MSTEKNKNIKMFEVLVRQNHRLCRAYALTLVKNQDTAEDLVQEAFMIAYNKIAEFDVNRDFAKWVRGIIRNKYLQYLSNRKEIPLENDILDFIDYKYEKINQYNSDFIENDILTSLRECIKKLDKIMQQIIELFYMRKMSSKEISQKTSLGEANIRKRLERSRTALAYCIEKKIGFKITGRELSK